MAFNPKAEQPEFASLKGTLAQMRNKKDDALYKTIQYLIERLTKFQAAINGDIVDINDSVNSVTSNLDNLADKKRSYVTINNETLYLPHSRALIAGPGITIDITQDGQVILSASGGYAPMATGAEPLEIMSDGAGHVLMVGFQP